MTLHFATEHEAVCYCRDAASGLNAIIAIHSTRLGPALGGTRIFPYVTEEDALRDVLELSRAMTYKAAAAELPFGGGKAVILSDPEDPEKKEKLKAFARFVNLFGGAFQTGEDMGTTQSDIEYLRQFTSLAHCSASNLPPSLESSALTARGVVRGIEASLAHRFGNSEIRGRTVAIQGLGKVGLNLARLLTEKGAHLILSDIRPGVVDRTVRELECRSIDPSEILSAQVDVFSPCAVGRVLTQETVGMLRTPIVAGCANNQLSDDSAAELLWQRKILYAPDFVINAGGLISALLEMGIEDQSQMLARVDAIGDRLLRIYSQAEDEKVSPLTIVYQKVRARLA